MTNKQLLFIKEYLIDLNATQAAIRAGYSKKTSGQMGQENLVKPEIEAAIAKALDKRNKRVDINADYVLKRLAEIDEMDAKDILNDDGELLPVKDWPKVWRTTISALDISSIVKGEDDYETVLKKIKWPDKVKNLELIGKHTDVQAWLDRKELSGKDGQPISIIIASDESEL